jgi:uncharacterized protein (DUF488 family)
MHPVGDYEPAEGCGAQCDRKYVSLSMSSNSAPVTVWTVGHSTLGIDEFTASLAANRIEVLADVRRFPGSKRHPQFGAEALRAALRTAGIRYEPFPELGGRRDPRPDSGNLAWRNASFRGYADYMETTEFEAAIERLLGIAGGERVAVMCAEAVWWRCHRGLIADFLKARGHDVLHIGTGGGTAVHPYTSAAEIVGGRLSYAGDPTLDV